MKNLKHLKIGRSLSRIPVNNPSDYVYPRPENKRLPFTERIVNGFAKYRPDLQVRIKSPGIAFENYVVKINDREALYAGGVHPFQTTRELLEDLTESGIINLTISDLAYIVKYIDKN